VTQLPRARRALLSSIGDMSNPLGVAATLRVARMQRRFRGVRVRREHRIERRLASRCTCRFVT
jgi:hypothetical protein